MNKLRYKFRIFHLNNPQVYALFDRFAREAIAAGRTSLSASLIFERMRWETQVITTDPDFKLNNNHRAYYARLWMFNNPATKASFRTRAVGSIFKEAA